MYYMVLEICIAGSRLEDCFYCYSQEIISAVDNESLTPHNLIQRAPETQNLVTLNVTPTQIKKIKDTDQFLEQKILFHKKINNKNTLFPPTYFDLLIADGGRGEITPPILFSG